VQDRAMGCALSCAVLAALGCFWRDAKNHTRDAYAPQRCG
jgi:hypothetical protein